MKATCATCSLLTCLVLAAVARAQTTRPTERLASWLLIGGAGGGPEDRFVKRELFSDGWNSAIAAMIQPQVNWGCRRIFIRNPFGTRLEPNGQHYVEFSQYRQAVQQTPWLTTGFVSEWRRLTEKGIEIVAYIGNPDTDEYIQSLKDDPHAQWLALVDNVEPYIQARMSIALDAVAPRGADSLSYKLAEFLRATGVKVYIEARPVKEASHWFDYPVICEQNFWARSDPARHPDAATLYARNEQLTGEKVIIIVPPDGVTWKWDDRGWELQRTRDVLNAGYTAAGPVFRYIELKLPWARFQRD